jgi:hypothetical protein
MNHSDRRQFLAWSAGANAFFAAHGCGLAESITPTETEGKDSPRIRRLELASAAPLADLKAFYHKSLGLKLTEDAPQRLTIAAGTTQLTFRSATASEGKPFYHFAFNIPENKLLKARDWQRQRSALLPIPKTLRDANYPDDVVNYAHWNAHSIFFFDPAGNVVEYIARHDLKSDARGDFGPEEILYASEIAFVVDDVPAATKSLTEVSRLSGYRGSSEQFAALGDERGLLLLMKRGRVISFDSPDRKAVDVFPTGVTIRGEKAAKWTLVKFPYELSVEA